MDIKDFAPWNWAKLIQGEERSDTDHLSVLRSDIQRAFESFREAFPTRVHAHWDVSSGDVEVPRIDVIEMESQVVIFAEMPGVKESEIEISVDDNALGIEGKKTAIELSREDTFFIHERTFGTFQRIIPLPARIDRDKIDATYLDGVVCIKVQKVAISTSADTEIEADQA